MSIGKAVIGVTLLAVLAGLTIYRPHGQQNKIVNPQVLSVTPHEVSVSGNRYAYTYFSALPINTKLIGNFDERISSAEISTKNGCTYGINGSFYNEKFEPLAGWQADGQVRKYITHNNLLNGYIGVTSSKDVWLGKSIPEVKMAWGMQSGPVLITNGKAELLNMSSDKPSRRSVAAVSRKGNLIFISIFDKNSRYDGPTMEMLPQIIEAISDQEHFEAVSAINLDGGSASAFYAPEDKLPELVVVGSWICVN